ncbi:MAG: transposase [Sedimentisphaerales bacterium]
MEPCFKQHTAVDDDYGVILDVETTTGEASEGKELLGQINRIEQATGNKVQTVTADAAYAHSKNYTILEKRGIEAIIPPQRQQKSPQRIPVNRFKYDGKHRIVRCPAGKILERSCRTDKGWFYKASAKDCAECPLRERCVSPTARSRTVLICFGYESLLRVRRRYRMRDDDFVNAGRRHSRRSQDPTRVETCRSQGISECVYTGAFDCHSNEPETPRGVSLFAFYPLRGQK